MDKLTAKIKTLKSIVKDLTREDKIFLRNLLSKEIVETAAEWEPVFEGTRGGDQICAAIKDVVTSAEIFPVSRHDCDDCSRCLSEGCKCCSACRSTKF